MPFSIAYDWEDLDVPAELGPENKFGDHYSDALTLEDAFEETRKYIRGTLGRQKHKFDEGRVIIHQMWDVTEYAKLKNRFGKNKKIDDVIRPVIGHHVQADVHRIHADILIKRVNQELAKHGQPLPVVGLAAWQSRTARSILDAIAVGKNVIMADLCARSGKTILSGVLIRETNAPITVIASYVLTSFASFAKDLSAFEQFKDLVLVDMAEDDYEHAINSALSHNQQVVVFLSLCNGTKRESKIKFLWSIDAPKLVCIDEADFGAHQANQAKALTSVRQYRDTVILMTGTNPDKAVNHWPVNHYVSVVYPELVMEKRQPQAVYPQQLRYFAIDPSRHKLVVDVEFYQMDLRSAIEWARNVDPDAFIDDGKFLPSWSKFAANPVKAKGFWTRMLQAVFLGHHGWDEMNIDLQTKRSAKEGQRVAMMFLSGSMRNADLEQAGNIAKQALPGYNIVMVYGDETTNREAEAYVKEEIEKAKAVGSDVLILSAGMAQRSFSRGEITELYLAYDQGDNGATVQKISRTLTPDRLGKIGRIISLSFDSNRDDKFDTLMLQTAINYKNNNNLESAKEALRQVLRTVDIFRCAEDGSIKLEVDSYLASAIDRKSVGRVVGKVSDLSLLSIDELKALSTGNAEVFRLAKQRAAQRGKTFGVTNTSNNHVTNQKDDHSTLIKKCREVITTIVENIDIIMLGTGKANLSEALDEIESDAAMTRAVQDEFGLDMIFIRELFDRGVINSDLIELMVDQ